MGPLSAGCLEIQTDFFLMCVVPTIRSYDMSVCEKMFYCDRV